MFELSLRVSTMMLYNGKRSLYIAVTIGRTRYWIQRWDLERDNKARIIERDRVMSWSWGRS